MIPNSDADLEVRLDELCRAIRLVYASTYSAESKGYIESTPNRLEEERMARHHPADRGQAARRLRLPESGRRRAHVRLLPGQGHEGRGRCRLGGAGAGEDGGRGRARRALLPRRTEAALSVLLDGGLPRTARSVEFYALDMTRAAPVRNGADRRGLQPCASRPRRGGGARHARPRRVRLLGRERQRLRGHRAGGFAARDDGRGARRRLRSRWPRHCGSCSRSAKAGFTSARSRSSSR